MEREWFTTPSGTRVAAVTTDEMANVDRVAVEEFGIDLLQMMENAGRNLATVVRSQLEPTESGSAVTVLAGNGGNGGGGLCCARHLANRDVPVTVVLDRPPEELDGAAAQQYEIIERMGLPVATGASGLDSNDADLVVDALVGYGLQRALRGPAASMVEALAAHRGPVVSLDVPSGVDATSGDNPGVAVTPERVVTLALPKTGLARLAAPVTLADISVPAGVYDRLDIPYENPFRDAYLVSLHRATRS